MEGGLQNRDIKPEESFFLMFIEKDGLEDKNKKKKVSSWLVCRKIGIESK